MAVLDELVAEIEQRLAARGGTAVGYRHATPTGNPTSHYNTGPSGIFGIPGLDRDIISTRVQPQGLAGDLPALGSMDDYPLFPYLTGFLAESGSNPDGVCDDPQTAGPPKSCIQTAQFGRYSFMTEEIELNRVGRRLNRGEFQDLRFVNDPLISGGGAGSGILAGLPGAAPNLAREMLWKMVSVGVSFQNKLMRQLWIGNPANNSGGGGYKEFPGLDILIGTNKVDALTGAECPSLDSDIKDFNFQHVDAGGPSNIVDALTYMFRYLRHNADAMGLSPVVWRIVMRRELFWEITAVWPCAYLTSRCSLMPDPGAQAVVSVDAGDQIAMRDAMRNGRYLLIDGDQVAVTLDDGIVELTNTTDNHVAAGCFASDIYVVPLTVRGGMPATYWEYLDYTQGAMPAAQDARYGDDFWTDGGRFLWHAKPPVNWCIQLLSKIEPRVILRTPQLAGRLQHVQYCPLQHSRDPFPTDPYFTDGGATWREGPSLYSDWNLPVRDTYGFTHL